MVANLRSGKKAPDQQQIQAQAEYEGMMARRQSARSVIAQHAKDNNWTQEEIEQVVGALGLDKEPGLLGGSNWTGFNNKGM